DALEAPDAIARTSDVLEEVETEFPANEEEVSSRQSHASRILLYFMKTYCLRQEPAADFSRNYTIPHYAQRLLDILHEIGVGVTLPIRGFICSIRDLLRAAESEGNIDVRLPEAFRQTQQLRSGLSQLQDRMREHIRQIAQEERASKALAQ